MKKFKVKTKDTSEDFIETNGVWLTFQENKEGYFFARKSNKSELLLGVSGSQKALHFFDNVNSGNILESLSSFKNESEANLYYINIHKKILFSQGEMGFYAVLFKRKEDSALEMNEGNFQAKIEEGDIFIGFSAPLLPSELDKLRVFLFHSKGFSYVLLRNLQKFLSQINVFSLPLFVLEVFPHLAYGFSLSSSLNNINVAIELIKNKMIKLHSPKIWKIETVLQEALTNAVTYGNQLDFSKTLKVSYEIGEKILRIIIKDEGSGFNVKDVSVPVGMEALEKISGRGIYIMKKFSDALFYNQKGNEVILFFKF
jgi:serine/threonine-protein kinase RsbW